MGCACLTKNNINEKTQIKNTKNIINGFKNVNSILNTSNDSSIKNQKELSFYEQKEGKKNTFTKIIKDSSKSLVDSKKEVLKNNYIISTKMSPKKGGPILAILEKSFNKRRNNSNI